MSQGTLQASIRAVTGTALSFNGDWLALFDAAGIPAGTFNERLLQWLNAQMGTSYASLPGAQAAYAASQGATTWSAIRSIGAGGGPTVDADAEAFLARAEATGATLDQAYRDATNQLVADLKAAGAWDALDVIVNLCAPTRSVALLNLKGDVYNAVTAGAPVFAANDGITMSGNNDGVNVPYVFPQNAGTFGFGIRGYVFQANARLYSDTETIYNLAQTGAANDGTLSSYRFHGGGNGTPAPTGFTSYNGITFHSRADSANCRLRNPTASTSYTRGSIAPGYSAIGIGNAVCYTGSPYTCMLLGPTQLSTAVEDAIQAAFDTFRVATGAPAH